MYFLSFINKELILFTSVYVVIVLVINSIWLHPKGLAPWKEWLIEQFWKWWAIKLRIAYIIIASVILYYLFELFLKLRFQLFLDITNLKDNEIRNLALAFLGTISGIGALFGVYLAILRSETTERQTYTDEQGLITDRINKATEGLGKSDVDGDPVIEVRLGALYALERTAQDSLRDHIQIMEILCSYVRQNSPLKNNDKKPREDIQAALTIIGRRGNGKGGKERLKKESSQKYRLDLRDCVLQEANLDGANLSNARLNNTNFCGAHFDRANLSGVRIFDANFSNVRFVWANIRNALFYNVNLTKATISRADLTGASFYNTELVHALLFKTDMTNTRLVRTNMSYANIKDANMENTTLKNVFAYKINFANCLNLIPKQLEDTFCGKNTRLPPNWKAPKHWSTDEVSYDVLKESWEKGKWDNLQLSLSFDNPND